ncbi:MAG: hypothetical protein ACRDS1_16625, partial [Pseudonocardiaceae bacterium]
RSPWTVRGVEIRGHAEALINQTPASSYTSPEVIRIYPHRVISWGIGPEPGMHGRDVDSAAASSESRLPVTASGDDPGELMTTG